MSERAADEGLRAVVERFAEGGPELLEARSLLRRTDHKLLTRAERLPALLGLFVDDHAIVLAGGERIARYATTYLDTDELRCFSDHRRGRPHRAKVRWRDHLDRGVTTLEVKQKTGRGETKKSRLEHPFLDHHLDEVARRFLGALVPFDTAAVRPVIENDFRRITFVAREADERVTVDLDVRFVADGHVVDLGDWAVIEIKTGGNPRLAPALARMRAQGLTETGFSKYAIGMIATHPSLRAGALRPWLRRLGCKEAA